MKTEKIILSLVLVVICILITQIFLAMAVLILCENTNSRIEIFAYVSSVAPGIILGLFLGKLFELLTGRNFGKMYYRFYSFDKSNNFDNDNKNVD
jgi:prolipoprotein diacylglyceryltransferase